MRVWGIQYQVRCSSDEVWKNDWTGPCGIYAMSFSNDYLQDILGGRPVFFRTRKLAREEAKRQNKESNKSWHWVKHRVIPIELNWLEK